MCVCYVPPCKGRNTGSKRIIARLGGGNLMVPEADYI